MIRIEVRNSLPGLNAKNTVVHGSQADSGVFTMASTQTANGSRATAINNVKNHDSNNSNSDGENQAE